MKQPILYLLCGPAASGKSTWCHQHVKADDIYVSRDEIRFARLKNSEDYFTHEKEVFKEYLSRIQDGLSKGNNVFADATHLNWSSRNKILKHINNEKVQIKVVVFNTPLNICLNRNSNREGLRRVPDNVIIDMFRRFSFPTYDNFKYDEIIFIDQEE